MQKLKIEDFDPDFIKVIEQLADSLKVKPAVMLENIFIRRIAEDRAEDDVFGSTKHLMPEFVQYDGEVKRGRELYKILYNLARQEYEKEYIHEIQRRLAGGLQFQDLQPEQRKLMERYKLDPLSQLEKAKAEHDIKQAQKNGDIGEVEITWNKKE